MFRNRIINGVEFSPADVTAEEQNRGPAVVSGGIWGGPCTDPGCPWCLSADALAALPAPF